MNSYYQIPAKYARTIVVGDIHGCFKELNRLLEIVRFGDDDVLVSVGDMLDRGPQSWEVCRFFRDTPNAHSVLGNHERRVAGTLKGSSRPAWSQKHSIAMLGPNEKQGWADYLLSLPAVIETQHVIITHARLDPAKPLTAQETFHTCAVGGHKVHIELDLNGVPLWFHEIDIEKPLCIGHIGYERTELVSGKLYALDTRCVRGGELTCAVFPSGKIFSVLSARNYYAESFQEWQEKETLLLGDVTRWPIAQVAKILKDSKRYDDPEKAAAVMKVRSAIDSLGIEEWAVGVREQLINRYGPVPEPGPERGKYFMMIKNSLGDPNLGALAGRIIAGKLLGIEAFSPIVRKGELAKIKEVMAALGEVINNSYIKDGDNGNSVPPIHVDDG